MIIDKVKVETVGEFSEEELKAYVALYKEKTQNRLTAIKLVSDEEFVDVYYEFKNPPFHRIRRITGYLVGNMDKWNNAKKKEEQDRVKHC